MTDSEVQRREIIRLILSLEQTGQVRMALSMGILRFCDRKLPRPRSVQERDPSRS